MALELIATVVFGVAAGGLATVARHMSGGRVPRFAIPAAAGLAMLGFSIWSEYAWFGRQVAALPEQVRVASTIAEPSPFRPWTYLAPYVSRFVAIDVGGARRHADAPGRLIVDVYVFERYAPTASAPILVDCVGARRADLADGAVFTADGGVSGVTWRQAGGDDPLINAACRES